MDLKGDRFPALEQKNVVHRLAPVAVGVQIEQSLRARKQLGAEIADAVAAAYQSWPASEAPPSPCRS